MAFVNFSAHAVNPTAAGPAAAAASAAASTDPDDHGFSFADALDIVNPLQHIPVVSTLYRKITGDQIKTFPKLAGDTLYGGAMGFAGSLADSIFTKITGKSFGDTALAYAQHLLDSSAPATGVAEAAPAAKAQPIDTTATPVASTAPALSAPAEVQPAALDTLMVPGQDTLIQALAGKDSALSVALRATEAYRRSLNVVPQPVPPPALRASLAE
ncbi:MAG: hypothetical protein WDM91_16325 [Rhizomicrobium sp.]